MERSVGTVSALKALGYPSHRCLSRCSCDELPCPLLSWVCVQLRTVCPELRDPNTSALTSDVLELSTLNQVTEFLTSELEAAHIIDHRRRHHEEKTDEEECAKEQRVEDMSCKVSDSEYRDNEEETQCRREAEMEAEWILILRALDLDPSSLWDDVLTEVKSRLDKLPDKAMIDPLLKTNLSAEQWRQVTKVNLVLTEDYQCRRQMMIKRFQVTLESFAWGEKEKERSTVLASVPPLVSLAGSSKVSPSLLLTAREDQSFICPIKAGSSTLVYKVLMGSVPDRGGRPGEIEPPMPMWDKQRAKGNNMGRGGRPQRHKHSDKKKKEKKQ
ncbi:protein FAM98B isoform X2 [Gouania willdenowi]|uniref:Protein FAM98B-like n=1 Tax=Gouania willdenowi TaxID=441366 RepID=A0A8C5DVB4_GOUWI|nr:protein FAM98B-like isoform X2 [Gouania willdenowi]